MKRTKQKAPLSNPLAMLLNLSTITKANNPADLGNRIRSLGSATIEHYRSGFEDLSLRSATCIIWDTIKDDRMEISQQRIPEDAYQNKTAVLISAFIWLTDLFLQEDWTRLRTRFSRA